MTIKEYIDYWNTYFISNNLITNERERFFEIAKGGQDKIYINFIALPNKEKYNNTLNNIEIWEHLKELLLANDECELKNLDYNISFLSNQTMKEVIHIAYYCMVYSDLKNDLLIIKHEQSI